MKIKTSVKDKPKEIEISVTTRNELKDHPTITFQDIINSANKLTPCPVSEIKVGRKFYKKLNKYMDSFLNPVVKPPKEKVFLGSLFGVKILIDPELKPNEYKIIKNS